MDICFFCESNGGSKDDAKQVRIYMQLGKDGNQVTYRYADVSVPRCARCRQVHRDRIVRWGLRVVAAVGAPIGLGIVFGFLLSRIHPDLVLMWYMLGAALGFLVKLRFEKALTDADVKSERKGILKTFPPLKASLESGWTFSRPTP